MLAPSKPQQQGRCPACRPARPARQQQQLVRTCADDARVAALPLCIPRCQLAKQLVQLRLAIDQVGRLPPRCKVALS